MIWVPQFFSLLLTDWVGFRSYARGSGDVLLGGVAGEQPPLGVRILNCAAEPRLRRRAENYRLRRRRAENYSKLLFEFVKIVRLESIFTFSFPRRIITGFCRCLGPTQRFEMKMIWVPQFLLLLADWVGFRGCAMGNGGVSLGGRCWGFVGSTPNSTFSNTVY